MSDEMFIQGKSYLSSKRAAHKSGYAQDYIGQLARKGLIDAQRIGGLWYVAMESLESYKEAAAAFKPEPPVAREQKKDPSTLVFFDGKEYISASRAAEITGYVQDYVGQLARTGQILARQVGNRWYVEKESIQQHKQEKDGLLAAVQAESVGLQRPHTPEPVYSNAEHAQKKETPVYTYTSDPADLLPVINRENSRDDHVISPETVLKSAAHATAIPIHKPVVRQPERESTTKYAQRAIPAAVKPQQVQLLPLALGTIATIVVVMSVGYTSVLKQNSAYAVAPLHISAPENLSASVGAAFNAIGDALEPFLTHELVYERTDTQ